MRLDIAVDLLRSQMWPLPALGVALAIGMGIALPRLDSATEGDLPQWLTDNLFGGGAEAARTVLSVIAGSMVTVTSLTFSLTVVTLQLASSQFSPRLLRTFGHDRFVQATLALFLATFAFALTVLRTVRVQGPDQEKFVPQISMTTAFILALASVLALVLFLSHLAQEIRVETMLRNVHEQASRVIRACPTPRSTDVVYEPPPVEPAGAIPIPAGKSGFVDRIDEASVLAAAIDTDATVLIDCYPGMTVVEGAPIGAAWRRSAGSFSQRAGTDVAERVRSAVRTSFERTGSQDVGFGLRQLTDVALKALSPGINDPTTAVHALGHSSALLCEVAKRDLGTRFLRDDDGQVRVVLSGPDLGDLLELAVAQPRHYGAADVFVMSRLHVLLAEVAWSAGHGQREAIADQLSLLRATVADQAFAEHERARLEELGHQVELALEGRRSRK